MIIVTILEGNIDDNLWPEIILTMTLVKNVRLINILKSSNSYQFLYNSPSNVIYLQVLRSIVCVFIHEEE